MVASLCIEILGVQQAREKINCKERERIGFLIKHNKGRSVCSEDWRDSTSGNVMPLDSLSLLWDLSHRHYPPMDKSKTALQKKANRKPIQGMSCSSPVLYSIWVKSLNKIKIAIFREDFWIIRFSRQFSDYILLKLIFKKKNLKYSANWLNLNLTVQKKYNKLNVILPG